MIPLKPLSAAVTLLKRLCAGQSMPVLRSILVEGTGNALRLTATDLDTTLRFEVAAPGCSFPPALVDAVSLGKALPPAKAREVEVARDGAGLRVCASLLASVIPVADYPSIVLPDPGASPVAPELLDALAYVRPAVSQDETRYMMSGVWFDGKAPRLAATDTHRLYLAPAPGVLAGLPAGGAIMRPEMADVLLGARKHVADWRGAFESERFAFAGEGTGVRVLASSRAVEGVFPPIDQVVPRVSRDRPWVDVSCDALSEALLAGAKVAGTRGSGGPGLHLDATAAGVAVATAPGSKHTYRAEVLAYDAKLPEAVLATYNPLLLAPALQGDRAVLSWNLKDAADSPLRIDLADGRHAILMPMRR